jgi:hypothetical protein
MNTLYRIIIISILLILTNEASTQWYSQYYSTGHFLGDIEFVNRYTGWGCGGNVIIKTTNGGIKWIQQSNPAQSYINQIYPVNDSVVYAAGECTILKI